MINLLSVIIFTSLCLLAKATPTDDVTSMRRSVRLLLSQLMTQRYYVEEQLRTGGNSGVRRMRISEFADRPYTSASHVDTDVAGIHNHVTKMRTVGLGEMVVVLNGVHFRTKHNDYILKKKHSKSKKFKATEDIEFPDVPPEVLEKETVEGQVEEMKEWFKAWKEQDDSRRDYKKYFKPVLCYMEGFWMNKDEKYLEEETHIDGSNGDGHNWYNGEDMARLMSYSGGADSWQTTSYLPTVVMDIPDNDSLPIIAQWAYQILCQPISGHLATSDLHPVSDVKARVANQLTEDEYLLANAARFYLARDDVIDSARVTKSLLDDVMEQVPGLDNAGARLEDEAVGGELFPFPGDGRRSLNAAYYHRMYVIRTSAPGVKVEGRSFSDETMFAALNTRPQLAQLERSSCGSAAGSCRSVKQRWSFAIPLEIIFLTPLTKWNPHGITRERGSNRKYPKQSGAIWQPFDRITDDLFFQTPYQFYEDPSRPRPPEKVKGVVYVKDGRGDPQPVRATGIHITLPRIPGVGVLRQRYPIMPVYGEGSPEWEEVSVIEEIIMNSNKYHELLGV